jgi:hypothetical protein
LSKKFFHQIAKYARTTPLLERGERNLKGVRSWAVRLAAMSLYPQTISGASKPKINHPNWRNKAKEGDHLNEDAIVSAMSE